MTTLPKICLALSAAGFAAGGIIDFSGFNVVPAVTAVLPLGAVFFGMFIITLMMEKEMAIFDDETARKQQLIKRDPVVTAGKDRPAFVRSRTASKPVAVPAP